MIPAPLRLTSALKSHQSAIATLTISLFSLVLTASTFTILPTLKHVTLPIAIIGSILSMVFFMVEYEISDKNQDRLIKWAKTKYGLQLTPDQASELYKYSLTEYPDGKNMIQLCLVGNNKNFSLHSTAKIKFLEEN